MIAIKQRLQKSLKRVLNQLDDEWIRTKDYNFSHIPMTFHLQNNKLNYRSAIALSLAGKQTIRASQVAAEIIQGLKTEISPDFAEIQGSPPAWIDLTLTPSAIGEWLQESLQNTTPQLIQLSPHPNIQSLPEYVRNRCLQLLQLANQENLIAFPDPSPSSNGILMADEFLLTPADWELLYQLMATRDRLEEVSTHTHREKLAHHLSDAFLEFHRHCQLFNQQQPDFHELAVIRFSAIAIAAQLLYECGY